MHCSEFLTLYSDYRDGMIADVRVLQHVRRHLRECLRCRRYDAAIRWGVAALRSAEVDVAPADSGRVRAADRLAAAGEEPRIPAPARLMGALMVAAAFSLVIWEAVATDSAGQTAATDSPLPSPVAIVNPGLPFVRFVDHATNPPWENGLAPILDTLAISPAYTLYQTTPQR